MGKFKRTKLSKFTNFNASFYNNYKSKAAITLLVIVTKILN